MERTVAIFLFFLGLCWANGQEMSEAERASAQSSLAMPTPGEIIASVDALVRPAWQSFVREDPPSIPKNRLLMAFVLGIEIADTYIAVQAQDGQTTKNIFRKILALAKKLNVEQTVVGRANSLSDFVGANEWIYARRELDIVQNEICSNMLEQKDDALATMLVLGGWVRAMGISSKLVAGAYTPNAAKFLRQENLARHFIGAIERLPEAVRKTDDCELLYEKITGIISIVTTPIAELGQVETFAVQMEEIEAALAPRAQTASKEEGSVGNGQTAP